MEARMYLSCLSALALLSLAGPSQAAGDGPYLYQRTGFDGKGAAVELETAIGARETRPVGEQGVEQGLRVQVGLNDRVSLEAWGGALLDSNRGDLRAGAFSADANVAVLRQRNQQIDLNVSVGYMLDFRGASVPHLQVNVGRDFGPVNVMVNGRAELPRAEGRDPVDVIIGAAASYGLNKSARVGLELVGEDLEGLWEPDEAEGGARLAVGPTVWVARGRHFQVKANAGAVLVASSSMRADSGSGAEGAESLPPGGVGFLGRVAVGYVF